MRKVLIGCGVALGLVVLGSVLASILAVRYFRTAMPDVERLEERQDALLERFGDPEDYLPPLDGRVDPARIETYLRVRDGMPAMGGRLGEALAEVEAAHREVDEAGGVNKVLKGLRLARRGMGVAALAMRTIAVRDSLLLAEEMGLGEYYHLTALGPVAWLQWDPPECGGGAGILGDGADEADVLEEGLVELGRVVRAQLETVLETLRAAPSPTAAQTAWRERLEAELARSRLAPATVPFQGALPDFVLDPWLDHGDALRSSLPPCRETWILELVSLQPRSERGVRVRLGDRE